MNQTSETEAENQEKAARIALVCAAYMEEYKAAAEAAGRNTEELAVVGPFDVVQVAGETFAQDRLGNFHPTMSPVGDSTVPFVTPLTFDAQPQRIAGLQISPDLLRVEDEGQMRELLREVAERNLQAEIVASTCPPAIDGYESLQPHLDRFFKDHPNYERNVFVMMRFRDDEHYLHLFSAIEAVLQRHDLLALRADQKSYPADDDLWANIVVYMLGCRYGIAIFEDFDEREFNANVALEYGFMRALNKRVLILKEQRMPKVPSDVTANRFKSFDMMHIDDTVPEQIEGWLRDIELS